MCEEEQLLEDAIVEKIMLEKIMIAIHTLTVNEHMIINELFFAGTALENYH